MTRCRRHLAVLVAVLIAQFGGTIGSAQSAFREKARQTRIGMNIAAPAAYGTSCPFLDVFKMSAE